MFFSCEEPFVVYVFHCLPAKNVTHKTNHKSDKSYLKVKKK
jgi:hypothetical protein